MVYFLDGVLGLPGVGRIVGIGILVQIFGTAVGPGERVYYF
jgi:hypothetical protein